MFLSSKNSKIFSIKQTFDVNTYPEGNEAARQVKKEQWPEQGEGFEESQRRE